MVHGHSVENEFATFRRTAGHLGITANAEPGALVKFLAPNERNRRNKRKVEIRFNGRAFSISVPYDLGRELRTAVGKSSDLTRNLAKCFERAYMATIPRDAFEYLGLEAACGAYDQHLASMEREGFAQLSSDFADILGQETYERLITALKCDLGFDIAAPATQRDDDYADTVRPTRAVVVQPLALFPT
jgi:hypothetical protein